jgi:exopolysaccharide biosynthesis polyprenyl glycosylphosphotransferase
MFLNPLPEAEAAGTAVTPSGSATEVLLPESVVRPLRCHGRRRAAVLARSLLGADIVAAAMGASITAAAAGVSTVDTTLFVAIVAFAWSAISFAFGLYGNADQLSSWASGVPDLPRALIVGAVSTWPVLGAAGLLNVADAAALTLSTLVATTVLTTIVRACVRAALHRFESLKQRTLVIGSGSVAAQLIQKLRVHDQFGLVPIGLIDDHVHEPVPPEVRALGGLADLDEILELQGIDRVIVTFSRARHEQLLECIRVCRDRGVAVDIVPRLFELLDGMRSLVYVGGLPLLSIGTLRPSRYAWASKRFLDIVGAATGLVLAAPLMLLIAVAIRLESPGPVLFSQTRAGRRRRVFQVVKFRSMYEDAEQRKHEYARQNDLSDGVMFKIHRDPRVTRVGHFLRRYSLDELPQLWNVLKGDMSLVGPRPLILVETDALEAWHLRRLELRPGLTGPWQVYGRSENTFQEMVRLDYQYVAGWSLARDLKILLATLPAVVSGRGAY